MSLRGPDCPGRPTATRSSEGPPIIISEQAVAAVSAALHSLRQPTNGKLANAVSFTRSSIGMTGEHISARPTATKNFGRALIGLNGERHELSHVEGPSTYLLLARPLKPVNISVGIRQGPGYHGLGKTLLDLASGKRPSMRLGSTSPSPTGFSPNCY